MTVETRNRISGFIKVFKKWLYKKFQKDSLLLVPCEDTGKVISYVPGRVSYRILYLLVP